MEFPKSLLEAAEEALRLPEPAASRWHRAGISPRTERIFDVGARLLLLLFAAGWLYAIGRARALGDAYVTPATRSIVAALTRPDAPTAAYLTQAVLEALVPLRGQSGKLAVVVEEPGAVVLEDSLPGGARLAVTAPGDTIITTRVPERRGVWRVAAAIGDVIRPIGDFSVITLVPFSEKRRGRIGLYFIGSWPGESGRRVPNPRYANPRGFIEVTPENQDTYVSEHFQLRDFLTKGQWNVWPKYLVLDLQLVDKLELVISELEAQGIDVRNVTVMSGFRTPSYNVSGGNTRGRAQLSRHMYGDAADVFVDNDADGVMDDLNGDGRVNIEDARVMLRAVDRVERAYPNLVGGAGVYSAAPGHGPFIHVDTRGYRARWVGSKGD